MKAAGYFLLVVIMGSVFSGCATIFSGTRQTIPIYSTPEGATVVINDSIYGKTPMHMDMKRKKKERHVKLVMDGYETFQTDMKRTLNSLVFFNILLGGLIGLGIDAATVAMYDVYPDHIDAQLKKIETH
ncbi:MAG: PEGA domain-containing protein [Bacteroidia bacterium]|nr:PEGA domain-containing protein [Bacteroidia bacterium]